MEIEDILRWTNGKLLNSEKLEITGVSTDTRTIKKNEIFIALKGERFDGHNFVKDAFEKGASYAIVKEKVTGKNEIIVKDTLFALGEIARNYRKNKNINMVVITGTVGKTTTKEYLYNIFSKKYNTAYNEKNYNNLIGVPISILKIKDENYGIFEIGTSRMGEIERLSEITLPDTGIITEITPVHLEFFKTLENVFFEKYSMVKYIKDKLIVNGDNDYLSRIEHKNVIKVGFKDRNHYRIKVLKINKNINFKINEDEFEIENRGKGALYCASIAIVTSLLAGIEKERIIKGINEELKAEHRMKIMRLGNINLIDDTYNASPASMKNAIDFISGKNFRIAVLGDMLELGPDSNELHKEIGEYLKGKVDLLICIGEYADNYIKGFGKGYYANNIDEATQLIFDNMKNDSWILIKGSRKLCLEKIIDKMRGKLCYTTYIF